MGPEIIVEAAQAVEKGGGEAVSRTPNYALLPSYVSVARDLEKRQRQDDIFSVDYFFSLRTVFRDTLFDARMLEILITQNIAILSSY